LNAALRLAAHESSARFEKAHPNRKIDALVALSQAAAVTLELSI
jgi:hypothetical protein